MPLVLESSRFRRGQGDARSWLMCSIRVDEQNHRADETGAEARRESYAERKRKVAERSCRFTVRFRAGDKPRLERRKILKPSSTYVGAEGTGARASLVTTVCTIVEIVQTTPSVEKVCAYIRLYDIAPMSD